MNLKEYLFVHCQTYVNQRMARIQQEIRHAQLSANEEPKNSAGDKYETGRAMAQLEVERNTMQLREAENLQILLRNIILGKEADVVIPGSLVITTQGTFYIAISLGLVIYGEQRCFVVSGDSPIGKLLVGKRAAESFSWGGKHYTIQSIE